MPFIALEGGEGSGKSTQVRLLTEALHKHYPDREVVQTREPGGTPYAEEIRSLALSNVLAKHASALTMFGLMTAARSEHTDKLIIKKIREGAIVISDRSLGSTYAYQVVADERKVSVALFEAHYHSLAVVPTMSIILDIDPVVGLTRVKRRSGDTMNHFDERNEEYHVRIRTGFLAFATSYPAKVIDADRTVEEVHKDTLRYAMQAIET